MNRENCCWHKNSVNKLLHIIALIVLVCGLWTHDWKLIIAAIILCLIGHLIQSGMENKKEPLKLKKKNKRAALEMSIGTIVIIVIAITMLILGIVFVRSVMCGALGLTIDLNDRVKGEIEDLFGATGAEVQCIGSAGEPIRMEPGKANIVYCGIKAPQAAKYSIFISDYSGIYSSKSTIKSWIQDESWGPLEVAPGDNIPKKVITLNLPTNAPEDTIRIVVQVKKEGTLISTQELDFKISRVGFFKAAMC